jgi:hypothetical protein
VLLGQSQIFVFDFRPSPNAFEDNTHFSILKVFEIIFKDKLLFRLLLYLTYKNNKNKQLYSQKEFSLALLQKNITNIGM